MNFRDLLEGKNVLEGKSDKEIIKYLQDTVNKVITTKLENEPNAYTKFDGLDKGKVGIIIDENGSDLASYDRYVEFIVYDKNTDEIEMNTSSNNTYKIKLEDKAKLIANMFGGAFYSSVLNIGDKKLSRSWK